MFYFLGAVSQRCDLTLVSADCIFAFIFLDECLLRQMASVSHLYSCLFTNEMVSNVLSVAFRTVMMIHSCVGEKKYVFISVLR